MRKLFVLIMTVLIPSVWAGGMVGNGGDSVIQDFNLRGIQLAAYFKAEPQVAQAAGIDAEVFLQIVRKTKLESKERLELNGVEVDAINYPSERRIEISRGRWLQSDSLKNAYFVQRRIALHEFLWVYGIADANYAVSNPIIANLEKSAALMLDPEIRKAVFEKFCDRIYSRRFVEAQSLLTWGMDLNQDCPYPAKRVARDQRRPLPLLISAPSTRHNDEAQRKTLIRKLLEYGADPNENCRPNGKVLAVAAVVELDVAQLLLDFGADPNSSSQTTGMGSNMSAFAFATLGKYGPYDWELSTKGFWLLFNAGGDVNLSFPNVWGIMSSPARIIVQAENKVDLVEALLETGKVDWCDSVEPRTQKRTFDEVRPEYQPLLEKYKISCGRFAAVSADAATCVQAKQVAERQCHLQGFAIATFDHQNYSDDGCAELSNGKTFRAYFHCTD